MDSNEKCAEDEQDEKEEQNKRTQNSKKNRNRIRRRRGVSDPARPFKILQMYTVQISTV